MFRQGPLMNGDELSNQFGTRPCSESQYFQLEPTNKNIIKPSGGRSRITSLSHLLAGGGSDVAANDHSSQPADGANTNNSTNTTNTNNGVSKSEKLGIRKLAKAYTKNLVGGWSNDTNLAATVRGISLEDDYLDRSKDIRSIRMDDNYRAEVLLKSSPNTGVEYKNALSQHKNSVKSLKKEKKPLRDNKNISNISNSEQQQQRTTTITTAISDNSQELILSGFPKNVGVNNILTFISGGPLEKVVPEVTNDNDEAPYVKKLYICFVRPEDAKEFFKYAQTGQFMVCGVHVNVEWLSNQTQSEFFHHHSPLPAQIMSKVNSGACRCLIIKKVAGKRQRPKSSSSYLKGYHAGRPHCSDFDVSEVSIMYKNFLRYLPLVLTI